jgi:hypothetical protein
MTGNEVLTLALSLMGEGAEDTSDYEELAPSLLSILCEECRRVNDTLREYRGKPILEQEIPARMEDALPLERELLYGVLPYGLAAKLSVEEGDASRVNFFEEIYRQALENAQVLSERAVDDVYKDGAQ